MANGFERVEQFEKLMEEVDYYIDRPTSFLYEKIEDPTLQEIVECTRVIALNNLYYIQDKKEELEKIKKVLEQARDIQPSKTIEEERKTTIEPTSKKEYRDLSEVMKLIIYNCLSDETIKVLESLSKEDYQRIKLHYHLRYYTNLKHRLYKHRIRNMI
jgi:hypothetical protein